jgi:hypothetical protein
MSLSSLVIVGKGNVPLYLRGFDEETEQGGCVSSSNPMDVDDVADDHNASTSDDPFGFFQSKVSKPKNDSCSLTQQFMIHAALDRFEELTKTEHLKGRPSVGPTAMWLGLLDCYDEIKCYGYMTSTKTKFMASVRDIQYEENQKILMEAGLKAMFANIHELYVEYSLNPFAQVREKKKISSRRFDIGVTELVDTFNETYGKEGMSWM